LRELGIPDDALVVGNVAALSDHKDHRTLVEAAALVVDKNPRVAFVVAGDGELRDELEARARQLGLGPRFVMLGFRRDVDRLLPVFDVFCLSSKLEGLGTSLLDAMCFGRCVVATDAGGIPEVVADGKSGWLVPVGRPEALAAALGEALAHPEERAARGASGRRLFEERYTAARMVEETLAVLADEPAPA
jgi:glycosyltransferase involved in cell wall biosynthesis